MDSIILIGQKNTFAEYMILSGANNRPPILDKDLYDSWKSRLELYMQNREHRRMILESVEHGLLIWPTIEENGVTRTKKYVELSATKKIQANTKANTLGIGGNYSGQQRVVKCFNCQGEGHMARQCLKPKRKRDATWFREKVLLVEAQGNGKVLNEEELEFLADLGIVEAKAVLMANLSSYGSDVLFEVPIFDNTNNDILNQSMQEMPYFESSHFMEHPENDIHSDSNIIPFSQYLIESQNAVVQDTNSSAQQDDFILSVFEQLSNQDGWGGVAAVGGWWIGVDVVVVVVVSHRVGIVAAVWWRWRRGGGRDGVGWCRMEVGGRNAVVGALAEGRRKLAGKDDGAGNVICVLGVAKDLWEESTTSKLINDMNIYKMKLEQFQVNTKFLNSLPPKWSKFVTDVKLVKDLHTTNFDQLHAYLEQHELHANEVCLMRERSHDPLALVANHQMTPSHFNTYQSSYNNPQFQQQQQFSPS
ncbi:retrovirus-related pol polyprotein from transposon TNT 1-94 [Tanacetum coccineum]